MPRKPESAWASLFIFRKGKSQKNFWKISKEFLTFVQTLKQEGCLPECGLRSYPMNLMRPVPPKGLVPVHRKTEFSVHGTRKTKEEP